MHPRGEGSTPYNGLSGEASHGCINSFIKHYMKMRRRLPNGKYVKGVPLFSKRNLKGCVPFLLKWYIIGKGLDLGAEPPRI